MPCCSLAGSAATAAAVRVTAAGLVYVQSDVAYQAALAARNASWPSEVAPTFPAPPARAARRSSRRLRATDPDNRVEAREIFPFPYSAVGYVEILDADGGVLGGCSGALIGSSLVLTAGHW